MGIKTAPSSLKRGFKQLIQQRGVFVFVIAFAIVGGSILLLATHAASPYASINADKGSLASGASILADGSASDGNSVKFGTVSTGGSGGAGNCPGLANGTAAFCDTFDKATVNPAGDREGELNANVWGVSREMGFNSLGQQQYNSAVKSLQIGGSCPSQTVTIQTDIKICNGIMNEVVNDNPDINTSNYNQNVESDNGTVTALAMYPKQPFDFAGRTGRIVFDLGNDTGGSHWAWPEFWVTDKPVPVPFTHFSSWQSLPQNGFGLRLDANCIPFNASISGSGYGGCGANCSGETGAVATLREGITINNFKENDNDIYNQGAGDTSSDNPGNLQVTADNCISQPTQAGQLNHFEVDVSQSRIDICGTDAGKVANPGDKCGTSGATTTGNLKHLGSIANAGLTWSRGFIWLEDAHYNANKAIGATDAYQAMHTFSWDNVGFDGPVLARDLGSDVADSFTTPPFPTANTTMTNLGYPSTAGSPANLTVPRVSGIAQAGAGLLEFNFIDPGTSPISLSYSLNGNATHTISWPFIDGAGNYTSGEDVNLSARTIAIPIALSEVLTGTNQVKIWSPNDTLIISNVDLIMAGAGGPGGVVTYP